jgi:hypothetical protein
MMHFRSYGFLLGCLLLAASCTHEEPVVDGCITFTFRTETPETKASGDAADGGKIVVDELGNPDLIIALVNSSNQIVAWYPKDFGPTGNDYTATHESHTPSTDADESIITISGPGKGTYSVYAVANSSAAGLTSARESLAAATTLSHLKAVILSVTEGQPSYASMPLSAKGTLHVNASGSGQVDLNLLRVVAKVDLTFENKTGVALNLYDCTVTLKAMNPSQGYLFHRESDKVTGYDRNLTLSGSSNPIEIAPNGLSPLAPKLVFPSIAPAQLMGRRYLCDISFKTSSDGEVYSFENLPVHNSRSEDIPAIERNKSVSIRTVISKKKTDYEVSFNFDVFPWEKITQNIEFN